MTESHNQGSETQSNFTQSGGSGGTQYNAHNQSIYYPPAIVTEQEKHVAYANALCAGLSRPDVDREDLVFAKGKKVEGTCEWVERDPEYKSLMAGGTHLLWVCGTPGKGKTMISIYLTQQLERTQQVVYFFCQAGNSKRTTAVNVLRSLLWQLVNKQLELSIHLKLDLDTPEKAEITLCSRETMWMMFLRVVKNSKLLPTICVLDGLDECDEDSQKWLATKFTDLLHTSGPSLLGLPLRAILISRPSNSALARCRKIVLDSDNEKTISTDIETFVFTKVRELSETLAVLPSTGPEILCKQLEDTILSKAEGTSLWVGLVMVELVEKDQEAHTCVWHCFLPLVSNPLAEVGHCHRWYTALAS